MVLLFFILLIAVVRRYRADLPAGNFGLNEMELALLKHELDSLLNVEDQPSLALRPFDPNLDSYDSMVAKGVPQRIAKNIVNYRAKVTSYKTVKDVRHLYAMDSSTYRQLAPYIVINEGEKVKGIIKHDPIELNACNAKDLEALKGIGPVLGKRIIAYRHALGGYYQKQQIAEVYGIDEQLYAQLQDEVYVGDSTKLRMLKLKDASFKELLRHPYLNYEQVKAWFSIKSDVEELDELNELVKMEIMSKNELERLLPYIEL